MMLFTNICVGCETQFETTTKNKKYCDNCRKNGIPYVCAVCGKECIVNCATHSIHANNGTLDTRRCHLCAVRSKDMREKQAQAAKTTWAAKESDHPHKVSATQRLKNAWEDPDVVARHKAAMNSEPVKAHMKESITAHYANPENREHASKKNIEVWKRPEHRAKWTKGGISYERASASHNAHWADPGNRKRREARLRQVVVETELSPEVYESIQETLDLYAGGGNLIEQLAKLGAKASVSYIRENCNSTEMWQELVSEIKNIRGKCYRVDLAAVTGYNRHTVGKYCVSLGITGVEYDLRGLQSDVERFIRTIYNGTIEIDKKYSFLLSKNGNPQQIDIYLPDIKLAIEVNGVYWHSNAILQDKHYHFGKSKQCREAGIRLIHIWEYEWSDSQKQAVLKSIIESALGTTKRVYARNFTVEYRPSVSMRAFFDTNNIQGFRGGEFAVCLIDATGEVWMAYLIGKGNHMSKKYKYEVVRGASKLGYTVVGGSSKLMHALFKDKQLEELVYYVDYNYFAGLSLMRDTRWSLLSEQPGLKNYFVKENVVKNREPKRHAEIKELVKSGDVWEIYDAGTATYLYRKEVTSFLEV